MDRLLEDIKAHKVAEQLRYDSLRRVVNDSMEHVNQSEVLNYFYFGMSRSQYKTAFEELKNDLNSEMIIIKKSNFRLFPKFYNNKLYSILFVAPGPTAYESFESWSYYFFEKYGTPDKLVRHYPVDSACWEFTNKIVIVSDSDATLPPYDEARVKYNRVSGSILKLEIADKMVYNLMDSLAIQNQRVKAEKERRSLELKRKEDSIKEAKFKNIENQL